MGVHLWDLLCENGAVVLPRDKGRGQGCVHSRTARFEIGRSWAITGPPLFPMFLGNNHLTQAVYG